MQTEQPVGCKGTNCGTTDNNHSAECHAEHDAAYKSDIYDTAGNRNPEFRYKGYRGEPLPAKHTLDEFNAYAEGIKARVTPLFVTSMQGDSEPEFCIASGAGCSIGPHGRKGEMQCEWCGKEYLDVPNYRLKV